MDNLGLFKSLVSFSECSKLKTYMFVRGSSKVVRGSSRWVVDHPSEQWLRNELGVGI